jgi:hypothetical protein
MSHKSQSKEQFVAVDHSLGFGPPPQSREQFVAVVRVRTVPWKGDELLSRLS